MYCTLTMILPKEEAIEQLERMHDEGCNLSPEAKTALELAVNALEMRIPKKPMRIDKNRVFDGNWKMVCPMCGAVLMERVTTPDESYPIHYNQHRFCWCGQWINWNLED